MSYKWNAADGIREYQSEYDLQKKVDAAVAAQKAGEMFEYYRAEYDFLWYCLESGRVWPAFTEQCFKTLDELERLAREQFTKEL